MRTMRNSSLMRGTRRSGAAAALLVLLCFSMTLSSCNWELDAYRALAVAQTSYEAYWRTVVTLYEQGVADEAYYKKAEDVANRIFNLGKGTTSLMVEYQKLRQAKDSQAGAMRAKIDAAVRELPGLLLALGQFAKGIKPAANGKYLPEDLRGFMTATQPKLDRASYDIAIIERLQEATR